MTTRNFALEPARDDELTPQRLRFAREIALHGDRLRAASSGGISTATTKSGLTSAANRLLSLDAVQDEIEKQRKLINSALNISDKRILAELASVGFGNICDIFDSKGGMKNIAELSEHTQRAIKSVRVKIGAAGDEIVSIEMHPKLPALQQLVSIKGMADNKKQDIKIKVEL